jgi:hypothetical protein
VNARKRIWRPTASLLRGLRVRRPVAQVLIAGAAVIALAALPFGLLTAQPAPGDSARTQILQLLSDLHSSQPGVAADAERQLTASGVTSPQLQYARLLKHPDRFERFRLISLLPQISEPLQTELRIELTRDHDHEVRASVINLTQPDHVRGPLAARLDEMLQQEPDATIRQRVEQLIMSRPRGGQFAPAPLNPDRPRPLNPVPATETPAPIEVHGAIHRPVERVLQDRDVSHTPPAPANNLPAPRTGVSPYKPQPGDTTLSTVAPRFNQQVDTTGSAVVGQYRAPVSSGVRPPPMHSVRPAIVGIPTQPMNAPTQHPDPIATASEHQAVPPVAWPITVDHASAGQTPFDRAMSQNAARTILPTSFTAIGIPPAPADVPAPPAELSAPPNRIRPGVSAALPVPVSQPLSIPAVEVGPAAVPGVVEFSVQPLFPSIGADSGDPLFQAPPKVGPTSSDDVGGRRLLDRPIDQIIQPTPPPLALMSEELLTTAPDAPFGFTGPSGIIPNETQTSPHFVPVPDRWRLGYEYQDRYGLEWPWTTDYLGNPGHWWDPYNQNVLKGDYPIIGQHTFLNVVATSQTTYDFRQTPIGTTPFESTRGPNQEEFFGQPETQNLNQNFFFRFDLLHANNAAFKPLDWQFRITPTVNMNQFHSEELAVINPDVRQGRNRIRDHFVLQEYFAEFKIADLSPDYDFVSVRAGNQLFNSDFRGFVFFDTNRAVRLFGSRFSNRHQFNLLFYDMVEKETNSGLNTTSDRHQNVVIANYYVQDFIWPGYTFQTSFHYNNDQPSTKFDRNDFLVRPDPVGVFQPHRVEAYYFGIAGDGHIGRINVDNAFYWVTGRDGLNPIAGRPQDINAFMGAIELSYDRDWARFRASLFFSSGDDNPSDTDAEGFDSIMDNPVFAGGEFSYWQRQAIQLFGVRLVNDRSLVPDLKSSGLQGQSNFVNPGIFMFNLGLDMDLTPKLRSITNANYIMFDETEVLAAYTFQGDIDKEVGLDISTGFEWRPFHNDNAIVLFGVSALIPDEGFKDLYNEFDGDVETFFAAFADVILTF